MATAEIDQTRAELTKLVQEKNCGPILVRLSWHDAGTYCIHSKTGGPRGCMRFKVSKFVPQYRVTLSFQTGESKYDANKGLEVARELLQPIKDKFPAISYADLWSLAAVVAVEAMGGPKINWKAGRKDAGESDSVVDGRLPDATKGADHVREIFYRMGFGDKEIVALSGAHSVGRCHLDRSGFDGAWTEDPLKFDNSYFKDLLNKTWEKKTLSNGNVQFQDKETGKLMMLPTDMVLIEDAKFRPFVEQYAADQDAFFNDFAAAFERLQSLGVF